MSLEIRALHKTYSDTRALDGVSLSVARGEIVALLGPSGCGKSTLLHLIAGLDAPDRGDILWDGASLAVTPPHRRGFGLMFQDYALFPHLTVAKNITFGQQFQPAADLPTLAELLQLTGLPGMESRDVATLSGGEQQRVALARALAPRPRLLMLDEPLGALDRALRARLLADLQHILRALRQTALYVTHDQEEAFALADRVAVMRAGTVEQTGTPAEIYRQPATEFIARFLGFTNILDGQWLPGGRLKTGVGLIPVASAPAETGAARLLIRPDAAEPSGADFSGIVQEKTFRGSLQRLTVQINDLPLTFEFPAAADLPEPGKPFAFRLNPAAIQTLPETP
jgi:ABC-type Fe3+/spermidine/putrescine transport system ATPase subunit